MRILLLAVLLASTLHAQTAKVIQLSPQDAALAKSLYEQKEALEKKIKDFNEGIEKHYLLEIKKNESGLTFCSGCLTYRAGWSGSFEFSEDFKFIVPKPYTPPPSNFFGGQYFTTTPALIAN